MAESNMVADGEDDIDVLASFGVLFISDPEDVGFSAQRLAGYLTVYASKVIYRTVLNTGVERDGGGGMEER